MARNTNKITYSGEDQHVGNTELSTFIDNCYMVYGQYVNSLRHVPTLMDGLKPVYKRMIFTAYQLPDKLTKTATIAGNCMATCFTGDTTVYDVNRDKEWKFSDLVNHDFTNDPIYTYACSPDMIKVKTRIKNVWQSKVADSVIRILFNNGKSFTSTLDHRIMLPNGSYIDAGLLKVGDSVESLDSVTVIKTELINTSIPVYDIEVESEYHNFMLGCSVIAHNCHPHAAQPAVVDQLVRWGFFTGKGNHGAYTILDGMIPGSAERYSEAKLNPTYRAQLSKLMPYVPTYLNDLGYSEPYYIPTPVPITAIFGASGIGIGIAVSIPAFTMKSMIDAYRNNDYTLLEADYGMEIPDKSELKSIWDNGNGRITYRYRINRDYSEDGYYGWYIRGVPALISPRLGKLISWKDEGKLLIRDETDSVMPCIFIARAKRISTISDEDIETEINKAFTRSKSYQIYATHNGITRPVGLHEWIKITYTNYCRLIDVYKKDKLNSVDFQIEIYKHFTDVARCIINDTDNKLSSEDIANQCGTTVDVVNAIGAKSINTLRTLDPSKKIDKLKNERTEIEAISDTNYIDDLVRDLSSLQ